MRGSEMPPKQRSSNLRWALWWLWPILWMGIIGWLSSDTFSTRHAGAVILPVLHQAMPDAGTAELASLHGGIRKLAHLAVYATLALLWYRALTRGRELSPRHAAVAALIITGCWGGGR